MPRRRTTFRTCSARSTAIARNSKRVLFAVVLTALLGSAAGNARADESPPPIATILAAYQGATHGNADAPIETIGTISGEGLSGSFHSWRIGDRERDDQSLGPRTETTLRIGDRIWVRNSNGNVHELTGYLHRRALTAEFVDSGAFLKAPDHVRFTGFGTVGDRRTWNVEINADGGEPETLWIDAQNGLPLRTEYLDGDGPTYVDLSDWREVGGMKIAYRSLTTDGEHAFDTVEQTTSVKLGGTIDPNVFAPLTGTRLHAAIAQTVPLLDDGSRVGCTVQIAGRPYTFLVDSGSGNVVLDSRVAAAAGLGAQGTLEVRGAVRTGGMHVALLPSLAIGSARLDDLVVSTLDLGSAAGHMRIDGILGYPFFATSLVQIDFPHHVMRFGPPGSFVPAGDRVALDTDREVPEAVFQVDGSLNAPFIVDTGNSGALLLYGPFVAQHAQLVPNVGAGPGSYIGIGGSDRSYATRLDSFRLGSQTFLGQAADVILAQNGAFADRIDAGNVGLGLLRKFIVTFDFTNHVMYLERPGV